MAVLRPLQGPILADRFLSPNEAREPTASRYQLGGRDAAVDHRILSSRT